jgi:chemotaxis response regulator CheB
MKLNCLVIEDSAVQRMIVVKLVNNNPQLHLVGDFSNAIEARNCLKIHDVDLIFLDIEMPIINGFSFLEGLKTKPQIIFITANGAVNTFSSAILFIIYNTTTDYSTKKPVKKILSISLLATIA